MPDEQRLAANSGRVSWLDMFKMNAQVNECSRKPGVTQLLTSGWLRYRDTRTSKTLAVVVAIDKTDDLAKAGFLGETDFNPSDR